MTKINENIDYGAAMKELTEQIIDGNWKLLQFASKMTPEDQNEYLPKIKKLIDDQKDLFKQPEQDIPIGLFEKPGSEDLENTLN